MKLRNYETLWLLFWTTRYMLILRIILCCLIKVVSQNVAGTTHIKGLHGSVYMEMLNALCRYGLLVAKFVNILISINLSVS